MRRAAAAFAILAVLASLAPGCGGKKAAAPAPEPTRVPVRLPPNVGELGRLAAGLTDKGPTLHGYTEMYERFLAPLRNEPVRILEIGIDQGGSLRLWRDYFPKAQVYGIDIVDCSRMDSERIHTFVADQSKRDRLGAFLQKYPGPYDVILDDGGHAMDQQQISLGFLFPQVTPGGLYIVEDVHTSISAFYSPRLFHVNADGKNTTLLMLETFVRTGKIESQYMTSDEARYVTEHVETSTLHYRANASHSIACILEKKR